MYISNILRHHEDLHGNCRLLNDGNLNIHIYETVCHFKCQKSSMHGTVFCKIFYQIDIQYVANGYNVHVQHYTRNKAIYIQGTNMSIFWIKLQTITSLWLSYSNIHNIQFQSFKTILVLKVHVQSLPPRQSGGCLFNQYELTL